MQLMTKQNKGKVEREEKKRGWYLLPELLHDTIDPLFIEVGVPGGVADVGTLDDHLQCQQTIRLRAHNVDPYSKQLLLSLPLFLLFSSSTCPLLSSSLSLVCVGYLLSFACSGKG